MREDFPAPVLPTTPIFSEGLMSTETPLSTNGRPSLYRRDTFLKEIAPEECQKGRGRGRRKWERRRRGDSVGTKREEEEEEEEAEEEEEEEEGG
jgi:hypothetical protein